MPKQHGTCIIRKIIGMEDEDELLKETISHVDSNMINGTSGS
ncbi:hypothetical protein H5410_014393 [Solanum commersonii]|uniref:Uncharacterized protein n=1 Tax=Solanum commersonii TaxID=4109 RepID=A0A9J5ZQU4_SOLCO|nr:hypothetical protein H5410_014393 [Solanum commersonii]